jgi:hypothetical protein
MVAVNMTVMQPQLQLRKSLAASLVKHVRKKIKKQLSLAVINTAVRMPNAQKVRPVQKRPRKWTVVRTANAVCRAMTVRIAVRKDNAYYFEEYDHRVHAGDHTPFYANCFCSV